MENKQEEIRQLKAEIISYIEYASVGRLVLIRNVLQGMFG